ncbi:O-antigen ligase family protein [Vibrio paucivorans]
MKVNTIIRGCVIAFPSTAFIGHSAMVVILAVLLFCGLWELRNNKELIPKNSKIIAFSFFAAFLLAIPNVILDQGRLAALDAPSRYLLCGIVLLLISRQKVNIEDYIHGVMVATVIGFIAYPLYLGYYLDLPRYRGELLGEEVNILSVAYFAFINSLILAYSSLYQANKNNWPIASLSFLLSILSFIIGYMSGSKVMLLCLPVLLVLFILLVGKLRKKYVLGIFSLAIVLAVASVSSIMKSELVERAVQDIEHIDDSKMTSTNLRLNMLKSGWLSFIESPIFGLGYDKRLEFQKSLNEQGEIKLSKKYLKDGKHSMHNEVVNALAKKGLIGLVLVLTLYFTPLWLALKQSTSKTAQNAGVVIMFVGSFILIGFTEAPLMGISTSVYYAINIIFLILSFPRNDTQKAEISS